MSNNSNEVNLKYEVSYNLRWYQEGTPSPNHHDAGVVGHRYVSRKKLGAKLRELYEREDINSISVVEHRSLSMEEIEALIEEAD
jgi:hypothetical protein